MIIKFIKFKLYHYASDNGLCRTRTGPCETRSMGVLDTSATHIVEQLQQTHATPSGHWAAVVKATSSHLPQQQQQQQQQQQTGHRQSRVSPTQSTSRVVSHKMMTAAKSAFYGKRSDSRPTSCRSARDNGKAETSDGITTPVL